MSADDAAKTVGELFASWYSALVHYATRATGSLDQAEDLVQETFLQLYRRVRDGGSVDNPRAWTLVVLRREVARQWRRERRAGVRVEVEDLDGLPATAPLAESGVRDELIRLLDVLTLREEEVVLLRLEALKYREIAERLGISVSSVNTLLARALGKLQQAAAAQPASKGKAGEDPDERRTLH